MRLTGPADSAGGQRWRCAGRNVVISTTSNGRAKTRKSPSCGRTCLVRLPLERVPVPVSLSLRERYWVDNAA